MPQSGAPLPTPPEGRRWTGAQSGRRVDPYKHPGKFVAPILCPQCGANQNGEGCSCAETVVDTRFAALAGIREELAKKNEQ